LSVAIPARLPGSAAALLVTLCAAWALGQVAMKIGGEGISPLVQTGLRSLLAIPLILAWCRRQGVAVWVRDGAMWPGLLAGVFFAAEFAAIFEALRHTTVARATVLIYTAPFFAVLGAHLLVPGDRLTRRKLAGLVLAFLGLIAAFADRLGGGGPLRGEALALLAGALWGFTIVTIKASVLTRIAPERTLLFQLAVSAPLLPLGLLLGEPGVFAPSATVWLALAYQVVGVATASYVAWFWLVARHPASALAPFLFLTPVLGVAFGAAALGEPVSLSLLAALVLIGAGIYVVNRG
jgi:drug/metabolite transporter (DMT)-like permease